MNNEKFSTQFDVCFTSEPLANLLDFRKSLIEDASKLVTFSDGFIKAQECEIKELRKAGESVPNFRHKLLLKANECFAKKHYILSWNVDGRIQSPHDLIFVKTVDGVRLQQNIHDLVSYTKNYCKYWKQTIIKIETAASYIRYLWVKNEEMICLLSKTPHKKYLEAAIQEPDEQTPEEFIAELEECQRQFFCQEQKREQRNRRSREKRKMKSSAELMEFV